MGQAMPSLASTPLRCLQVTRTATLRNLLATRRSPPGCSRMRRSHSPGSWTAVPSKPSTQRTTNLNHAEPICRSLKEKAMTTNQLIDLLVADLKPVDERRTLHAVIVALVIGLAAALGVMSLIFASPPELLDGKNLVFLLVKLLFASAVVATTAVFLPQLARPGIKMRRTPALILAILPFTALMWGLRAGAPTDRIMAGTIAGLAAGGLGAFACAFPCTEQSLPSIALWYGFPVGVCAAVGAKLGPSLLRW